MARETNVKTVVTNDRMTGNGIDFGPD